MKQSLKQFFALVVAVLLLCGCQQESAPTQQVVVEKKPLRVANVRITSKLIEDEGQDMPYVRVYYSYLYGGKWETVPSEACDLHAIFQEEQVSAWDAAKNDHIVRIGNYLIICFIQGTVLPGGDFAPCEISDSLGSEVQRPFAKYETVLTDTSSQRYGFFAAINADKETGVYERTHEINMFLPRYYLVLDYEDLTEDYTLQYTSQGAEDTSVQTLTYAQIRELVGDPSDSPDLPTAPYEPDPQSQQDTGNGVKLDPGVDYIDQGIVRAGRHEAAYLTPDLSGNISDIRMTVVPREYYLGAHYPQEMRDFIAAFDYTQIFYGYCIDGTWYDIPSENYPLRGIFADAYRFTGYDLAGGSHIVKMGPYLLICVALEMHIGTDPNYYCQIQDTLGSEVLEPFAEYCTPGVFDVSDVSDGAQRYGFFKENNATFDSSRGTEYWASLDFDKYYYLILDYETLPEDYVLTVTYHEETETTHTLDYNRIKFLIGE